MKNVGKVLFIVSALIGLWACDETSECDCLTQKCDEDVVVSADIFENDPNDPVYIDTIVVEANCMLISFGASGCDGRSWEVKLIDSDAIMESIPEQRMLRLSIKNEELCNAFFMKELSFNITSLQTSESTVILNIEGYSYPILYEY